MLEGALEAGLMPPGPLDRSRDLWRCRRSAKAKQFTLFPSVENALRVTNVQGLISRAVRDEG